MATHLQACFVAMTIHFMPWRRNRYCFDHYGVHVAQFRSMAAKWILAAHICAHSSSCSSKAMAQQLLCMLTTSVIRTQKAHALLQRVGWSSACKRKPQQRHCAKGCSSWQSRTPLPVDTDTDILHKSRTSTRRHRVTHARRLVNGEGTRGCGVELGGQAALLGLVGLERWQHAGRSERTVTPPLLNTNTTQP